MLAILISQVASPLVIILVAASLISLAVGDVTEASIILIIVALSTTLGFVQEARSQVVLQALQERVALQASVIRDGAGARILASQLVAGDLVELAAGAVVPADGRVVAANHLQVDEAALTGESVPAQKQVLDHVPDANAAADRAALLFAGTSVVSGSGRFVLTATGRRTEYGQIAQHLASRAPENDFQHGIRAFGVLVTRVILLLVVAVLAINIALHRPLIDSLLFAVALAVGLTPELLPAIVTLNLTRGARALEAHGVLVRHLPSIQNLGSMTVLCSDKTGTLTQGLLQVDATFGLDGGPAPRALALARINSRLQAGFPNPLDQAILATPEPSAPTGGSAPTKLLEIPFDFVRRRLTVVARMPDGQLLLVSKGAPDQLLACCTDVRTGSGDAVRPVDGAAHTSLSALEADLGGKGLRTVGVATRILEAAPTGADLAEHAESLERGLTFEGLLSVADPPRPGVGDTIAELQRRQVRLKIITGDDLRVAATIAERVGLVVEGTLTGDEIRALTPTALAARATTTTIFARVDPDQKLRIVAALRSRGEVVGYTGDGINDAPALHEADVGISVQGATDVAQSAADLVLQEPGLESIARGVVEGRRTFANTLKYIRMGTSSNFGNMLSMAGAALVLPFLPMLPGQILLNNLLYDLSQTSIPSDEIDEEQADLPARWDLRGIERFMAVFGPLSSVFDYLTFGLLLVVLNANEQTFHTGWFVESLATQVLVVFAIRTRRVPFWRSRPSPLLAAAAIAVVVIAVLLPISPLAGPLGFVALPPVFWLLLGLMVVGYIGLVELVKRPLAGRS